MKAVTDERHGEILVTEHVHMLIEKDKREWCPQRTDPWYKKRNNHLTASAIATACGANQYETKSTLILRKTGNAPAFKGNAACDHGNKYEQEAIEKYEGVSGEKCLEFGLLKSLNENEDFIAGSPDGITASGRLIEVKCPYKRIPTNVVPDVYRYQVQTLMHILRLPKCDFIQYVPETVWKNETFIITEVKYDPYFWRAKFPILQRCWQEILDVREAQMKGEYMQIEQNTGDDDTNALIPHGKIINIPAPKPKCNITLDNNATMASSDDNKVNSSSSPDWSCMKQFFDDAIQNVDNKQKESEAKQLEYKNCLISL